MSLADDVNAVLGNNPAGNPAGAPTKGKRGFLSLEEVHGDNFDAWSKTPEGIEKLAARDRKRAYRADVKSDGPKRGPGRPRNEDRAPPARKDGKPTATPTPGATLGTAAKVAFAPTKDDVDRLARHIEGLHMIAALATGIPEARLTSKESESLAIAISAVAAQYDLAIDGKTGALLQLAGAAAMVYTPRVFAYRARLKRAKSGNPDLPFPPAADPAQAGTVQ